MNSIGIFGGTFDPVHNGHIALAKEALYQCSLRKVIFIPCNKSRNKKPRATKENRLEMLRFAVKDNQNFSIDETELKRGGISYTIDTLKALSYKYENDSLCLIMAMDNFVKINAWYKWESIIKYSHIIVSNRNDISINKDLEKFLEKHQTFDVEKLHNEKNGSVFFIKTSLDSISSTMIRSLINRNEVKRGIGKEM